MKTKLFTSILIMIVLLTSCSLVDPVAPEQTQYYEFEVIGTSGYMQYAGWDIYITLADSVLYTVDTIEALKQVILETNELLDDYTLSITQMLTHIRLEYSPLSGEYEPEYDRIIMSRYSSDVLIHEIGHVRMWHNYSYSSDGYAATNVADIYDTQKDLWGIWRAADNKWEYFAELFRFYHTDPDFLREKDSIGYAFIQKVLNQR